jgi:phage terminase small subunit
LAGKETQNDSDRPLNARQRNFIDEYLVDLNATKAAIRAGYSEKTAHVIGCENLKKPNILSAIQDRRDQLAAKAGVTQERVVEEYAKIAFLDPQLLFDDDGHLLPIQSIPKEVAAAIGGLDVSQRQTSQGEDPEWETVKKIKLIDKKGALDSLARHLGLFERDNKQRLGDALESLLDKIASNGPPKPPGAND